MTLDPNLLHKATNVSSEQMKESESQDPLSLYLDSENIVFVIFNTETSCAGKNTEITQLASKHSKEKFSMHVYYPNMTSHHM